MERLQEIVICIVDRLVVFDILLIIAMFIVLDVVGIHLLLNMYSVFLKVNEHRPKNIVCQPICTDADGSSSSSSSSSSD